MVSNSTNGGTNSSVSGKSMKSMKSIAGIIARFPNLAVGTEAVAKAQKMLQEMKEEIERANLSLTNLERRQGKGDSTNNQCSGLGEDGHGADNLDNHNNGTIGGNIIGNSSSNSL